MSDDAPTVSIIITSFNYASFLGEAIASALDQTYRPIEVIVIDDGSSDRSLEIARTYPVTLLSQTNQGVCAARNNAAQLATGKYLYFLDADDVMLPDAIAHLLPLVDGAPDGIGYAYGQAEYFDRKSHIFTSGPFDPRRLKRGNYIQVSALFRKSAFDEVGGFDRGFTLREDWELYVRLYRHGCRGAYLARPHFRYRKHKPPSPNKSKLPKRLSEAKLIAAHPGFFAGRLLRHPLRNLYLMQRYRIRQSVGHYGPTQDRPKILRTADSP